MREVLGLQVLSVKVNNGVSNVKDWNKIDTIIGERKRMRPEMF